MEDGRFLIFSTSSMIVPTGTGYSTTYGAIYAAGSTVVYGSYLHKYVVGSRQASNQLVAIGTGRYCSLASIESVPYVYSE